MIMRDFKIVLLALAVVLTAYLFQSDRSEAQNVPCYGTQGGALIVAGQDCDYAWKPQTEITVTGAADITHTGVFQLITAATPVTPTGIADGYDGQWLILWNSGTNAIVISDTATVNVGTNVTLGADDNIALIYDQDEDAWYKLWASDN